jgi:hypothetical protein
MNRKDMPGFFEFSAMNISVGLEAEAVLRSLETRLFKQSRCLDSNKKILPRISGFLQFQSKIGNILIS